MHARPTGIKKLSRNTKHAFLEITVGNLHTNLIVSILDYHQVMPCMATTKNGTHKYQFTQSASKRFSIQFAMKKETNCQNCILFMTNQSLLNRDVSLNIEIWPQRERQCELIISASK